MKKLFLKSLALVLMLTMSVSMWAVDWSGIDYLGDGAGGGAYSNKYKFSGDGSPVNIQQPGTPAPGIYMTFPDAAFGEVRINDVVADYNPMGAAICIYLSNFTAKQTEVHVMNSGNTEVRWTFFIYKEDGEGELPGGEPGGEPGPEPEIEWSEYWGYTPECSAWANKIKVQKVTNLVHVNLQPYSGKPAIRLEVQNLGAITACSLDAETYHIEGAGIWIYLESLTEEITDVTFTCALGNVSFKISNEAAAQTGPEPGPGPETDPDNLFNLATASFESWFGDAGWAPLASSTASYDASAGTISCTINQDPYGQWHAQLKLTHDVNFDANKYYQFSCKFNCSVATNGITLKIDDNTAMIYEDQSINAPAGEYTYTSDIKRGIAGNNHVLVFDLGNAANGAVVTISELVIKEVEAPAIDLCAGRVAASSNNETAAQSADGNAGTRWASKNEDGNEIQWQINYETPQTFNRVKIIWEGAYGKSFDILAGNDCDNMTKIAEVRDQNLAGFPYTQIIELDESVTASHVRFQGVEKATGWGYSFWEFETYEAVASVLSSLDFTASAAICKVGESVNLTATPKDQYGVAMDGQTVTYEVSPATAGHVTDGKYYADAFGPATITATCGAFSKQVSVMGYQGENLALSTDIATDNKIIAQSEFAPSGTNAFFAVDADNGSVWQGSKTNGNDPVTGTDYDSWFVVDLGANYDINFVMISFEGACSQNYTLDFSANNVDWVNGYTYAGNAGVNGHVDYIYEGSSKNLTNNGNVRYVRFWSTKAATEWGMKMYYFKVFGTEAASATKQVSATVNDAAMGTAVVKQNGVAVTEVENGSNVDFIAEANDGYVFTGWYNGATLVSTNATYTVENIQAKTSLEARFRALNTIYCHTELTNAGGDKTIYLTMKRTAENQYQVVIDSEEEMKEFSNAYIGGINGNNEIRLNDATGGKQNVIVSDNKHRLTVDVTSTTPIKWNSPIYINMPGEVTFNQPVNPQNKVVEYDVTCAPVAVETVTLNQTEATIDVEGTVTLTAAASPIYADNQTVTWTSNNESVATVVNGVVTGKAEGNATITATIDGKTATCAITVALDPTVPHVAAPAVDVVGKDYRAIYADGIELAITDADFRINAYGNVPSVQKAIEGNNYWLCTAEEDKKVISWGNGNGWEGALLGKAGMTNPENDGDKGLYAVGMKYLHIDIWSSEAATNFQICNDNNIICMVDLEGSGWQSFDIDVTGKENLLKNISIIKFLNTPTNTKVALDNLYFWKLEDVHATGVTLNKTATSIMEGAQETLVATIAPANATFTECTWTSNAEAIATVADGVVTAVAPGTATITVTTVDGGFTATCTVTVTADMTRPQEAAPAVATDGVEIRAIYTDDVTLAIAHDFGFNPWGGAPVSKQVVAANNYLLIDAATANNMTMGLNNDGATAIIAKDGMSDPENTDNKGLYVAGMKYCHIDIWSKVAKENVKVLINDHALTSINLTDAGWQSFDIELVDADMTAAANVRWMKVIDLPTETKIAIDNIYFWKSNGTAAVTGVELNKTTLAMETGDEITLVATVLPAAAANKNVTWSSNAPTVANVDENGKVIALTAGNATITVTTADGGFTATCAVSVTAAVTKTWYGFAEDNGLGFDYAITLNTDKTITIVMTRLGNDKPGIVNPSVNIGGDDAGCSLEGDSWTRTTTATFVKGQTITVSIANAYALHACNPSFNYTVGAENTKDWMIFSETADNAAAISAANGTTTDFVLGRTFVADGYWYTLCLPFNASAAQITEALGCGYTLAYLSNSYMKSETMLYLDFAYTDEIVAGRPYLFMPDANVNYPVFQGVTINGTASTSINTTKASMVGFYNPTVVSGDQYFLGDENYLLKNNTTNATKAFRAYFTLDESVPAGVRARVVMGGQAATGINNTNSENRPTKFMQDGKLFIMKQGRTFNVQGQLVK